MSGSRYGRMLGDMAQALADISRPSVCVALLVLVAGWLTAAPPPPARLVEPPLKRLAQEVIAGTINRDDAPEIMKASSLAAVAPLAFTADGKVLLTGGWDVDLWDAATGKRLATLGGHIGAVYALQLSPDRKVLAIADAGRCRFWDIAARKQLALPAYLKARSDKREIDAVAFSPDGKAIAVLMSNPLIIAGGYQVIVWDRGTGRVLAQMRAHFVKRGLYYSPDSKFLAMKLHVSEVGKKYVAVWDLRTGKQCEVPDSADSYPKGFAPEGRRLALMRDGSKTICLHDLVTGKDVFRLSAPQFSTLAFSPDGKILVTGEFTTDKKGAPSWSSPGIIRLWDAYTGKLRTTLPKQVGPVHCLVFSPDGKTLASMSALDQRIPNHVCLWDVASGKLKIALREDMPLPFALTFRPAGRLIAWVADPLHPWLPGNIQTWDVAKKKRLAVQPGRAPWPGAVAFGDSGIVVEASSYPRKDRFDAIDRVLQALDPASGVLRAGWVCGKVSQLAVAPDSRSVALSWPDSDTVTVRDLATGTLRHSLKGNEENVLCMAYSRDGKLLASGGGSIGQATPGILRLWDAKSGKQRHAINAGSEQIYQVALSPDGKRVAAVSKDSRVETAYLEVWETTGGTRVADLREAWQAAWGPEMAALFGVKDPFYQRIHGLTFTPDGKTLVVCCADGTTRLWNLRRKKLTSVLRGHRGAVICVAVAADGRTLAMGGQDGTIRVWDLKTGKQQSVFPVAAEIAAPSR